MLAKKHCLLSFSFLMLFSTASAGYSDEISSSVRTSLPAYCTPKLNGDVVGSSPLGKYWVKQLGANNYSHIHHYCWGLGREVNAQRYWVSNPQLWKSMIITSIADYDYFLKRATPDFFLLPKIILQKGLLLHRLGHYKQAIAQYDLAI